MDCISVSLESHTMGP